MQEYFFNIDVVGSCNLKCPSCPVGNFQEVKNPTGFMKPEFLSEIMNKATSECKVTGVGLFNWTEPLLHPQLPELVRIVQTYNIPCHLSSNLNILKNIDALMQVNPFGFRISVSGFTQAVYGVTHRGGDIERVKKNMVALAEAKQRASATTHIHVLYHRYLGNMDDEILMKNFAESLGFDFSPVWAVMMPLEKGLAYLDKDPTQANLTQEDLQLIERLALPLNHELVEIAERYKNKPCRLRDNEITINFEGNVQLCCAVYDDSKFRIAAFLSTPLEMLQDKKYAQKICTKCMDKGLHVVGTYGSTEFDELARNKIIQRYSRYLGSELQLDIVPWKERAKYIMDAFDLREINVVIFPDWSKLEAPLYSEIKNVVKVILKHPDRNKITLLITTSGLGDNSEGDANGILADMIMDILMEEELDVTDETSISFVNRPEDIQRLLPLIHSRIILENENLLAVAESGIRSISTWELHQLNRTRFSQAKLSYVTTH